MAPLDATRRRISHGHHCQMPSSVHRRYCCMFIHWWERGQCTCSELPCHKCGQHAPWSPLQAAIALLKELHCARPPAPAKKAARCLWAVTSSCRDRTRAETRKPGLSPEGYEQIHSTAEIPQYLQRSRMWLHRAKEHQPFETMQDVQLLKQL